MNRSLLILRLVIACTVAGLAIPVTWAQAPNAAPAPAPSAAPAEAPSGAPAADQTAPATPPVPAAAPAQPAPTPLDALSWLHGCWSGEVNRRDFVEQWLPPRAGMMVGVSHTIVENRKNASQWRTEDYTYLRLEARPDGIYYVAIPSGKTELSFKYVGVEDDKGTQVYTFSGPAEGFPQRIVYRRTEPGFVFAQVTGTMDGHDKEVTYPMRLVDCASVRPHP